jgi:hypothetical protein
VNSNWIRHDQRGRPPRFIVDCPACLEGERVVATYTTQSSEMCGLCCGHGRVGRTSAERYELARRPSA